jgi:hypothetical protein
MASAEDRARPAASHLAQPTTSPKSITEGKELMSESGFGQPTEPDDGWPFDQPGLDHGYLDLGADGTGSRTQPYPEWHHDEAAPRDGGPGGYSQGMEPPIRWPGPGTYVPGPGQRPPLYGPGEPEPRRAAGHRRTGRSPWRPVTITALLAAMVAAVIVITFPRSGTGTPTDPGASTARGTGVMADGRQPPPAPRQTVTVKQAEQIVSHYWEVNNEANEQRSDSLLGTIEAGSSYTMDAGAYRFELGQPSQAAYVPFQLTDTTYYIPRLAQGSYPRWFAVKSTYTTTADGKTLSNAYLVFAQDSAGAPWKDVVEPDILPGQSLPQIAVDSSGYAEGVAPDADGLNVAPDKIGQVTAEWLDQLAASKSDSVIKDESGNLTDLQDEVFWRSGQGGTPMDATDVHSAPADQVFALKTTSGGALVFYTTDAQLALSPPDGAAIGAITIPGYYSPSSSAGLTEATVGYVEQFATYIPPAGSNARDVVADISSIASRG